MEHRLMLTAFGVADILQKKVYPILSLKVEYYLKHILNSANFFLLFSIATLLQQQKLLYLCLNELIK